MTNEKKLEVIEEAFNYYHDRTSLNNKEEKELLLLVNEIYAAINRAELKAIDIRIVEDIRDPHWEEYMRPSLGKIY